MANLQSKLVAALEEFPIYKSVYLPKVQGSKIEHARTKLEHGQDVEDYEAEEVLEIIERYT